MGDGTRIRERLEAQKASARPKYPAMHQNLPGSLQQILAGKMGPIGPVTQMVLLGTSVTLVISSVMIFLSLVLKPNVNRRLNIVLGVVYTAIILITMWRWVFYIFYGVIEIALTGLVVWYAWKWPKHADHP
jgi:hypothetical protein